ncbi:MAG: hypothetical protein KAH77_00650 [Thiomargarita sp.]|nr:hypothetical protein [Thiomargarita sp.]
MRVIKKTISMITVIRVVIFILIISFCAGLQWHLLQVFNAVGDTIAFNIDNDTADSSLSLIEMNMDRSVSYNILYCLEVLQSPDLPADMKTLWATMSTYFWALLMTLGIALMAAFMLSSLAYGGAMLIDELRKRGKGGWIFSKLFTALIDTIPYILWSILFLSAALSILGHNPASYFAYLQYLLALYLGFGMFLLPFFIQENMRQFHTARHDGVFDGESMSGLSDTRIRLRLLKYRFNRHFFRQVLYASIFMMLFDFSLFSVINTYQEKYLPTVFVQANIYYNENYLPVKNAYGADAFQQLLTAFSEQVTDKHDAYPLVMRLINHPWEMLSASNQEALQRLIAEDPLEITLTVNDDVWDKDSILDQMFLSRNEQNMIFFKALSDYYIFMNVLVLFGLFMIVFLKFDIKKLFYNT